ncbi:MAG: PAC2 family protein [Aigarchaeota archaeon]|nr:PAC2 family protein [Aigarchaeota archaeon]MDW8092840.1 PAC2 family protein [Nitrososphaerota archaeon]
MQTELVELKRFKPSDELTVIEVAPSVGVIGLLLANILVESLESEKVAEVYSPYFPQVSVVNNEGVSSLPKIEIYALHPKKGKDIVLISRNFPIEGTTEGAEVSSLIFNYLHGLGQGELVTITSGRVTGTGDVFAASNSIEQSRQLVKFGAKIAPSIDNLPLDKLSSSLMLNYMISSRPVYLIISDTTSYVPDLMLVKKTLSVLTNFLKIEVDTTKLDQEIKHQQELLEEFTKSMSEPGRGTGLPPSYIG